MLDVKGYPDSLLYSIHQTCKSSQLIILDVFKYKMSRVLQFWCKLNTRGNAKTCLFHFLHDHFGDSLNAMFPWFPNHILPFPMVFLHVSPSVSMISSGLSTVSPQSFPCFLFQILHNSPEEISQYELYICFVECPMEL